MDKIDRNIIIIKAVLQHCKNIYSAQKRFGKNMETFTKDTDYFNSVCMSLLQIGELANHLTDKFKQVNKSIPWRQIIGLRNIVVHRYGQIDIEVIWATVKEDVPKLHNYCKRLIEESKV